MTNIFATVWVGPWESCVVADFDVVYLMAPEIQVSERKNVIVVEALDQPPYEPLFTKAGLTAGKVLADVDAGRKVAICCREGLNRSALTGAIAMTAYLGWRGEDVFNFLQSPSAIGPRALYNQALADYVRFTL